MSLASETTSGGRTRFQCAEPLRIEARSGMHGMQFTNFLKGSFSGSEHYQKILLGQQRGLKLLVGNTLFFFGELQKFIYLFSISPKLAGDRWGSIAFLKVTP